MAPAPEPLTEGTRAGRAYRDLLHLPSAGLRHRDVRSATSAPPCSVLDGVDRSRRSSSSTSRPGRSARGWRRSTSPCAATMSAPRGSSAAPTSTSSCCSTSTASSAGATATTSSRSPGAGAAARRDAAHPALGADAHQARCSPALCGQAELVIVMTDTARRILLVDGRPARRARSASSRTARRRCCRGGGELAHGSRPRYVAPMPAGRRLGPLPALHVRPDLGRQGPRDGDRGAAGDHRAPPRGALPDRRPYASRCRAPRRRALPPVAGARGARRSASRTTSSSTTASSRSTRSPISSPSPTSS